MIIGIDLGTNNVCISYFFNNELRLIKDNQDNQFIKSLIAINNDIIINIAKVTRTISFFTFSDSTRLSCLTSTLQNSDFFRGPATQ